MSIGGYGFMAIVKKFCLRVSIVGHGFMAVWNCKRACLGISIGGYGFKAIVKGFVCG